MMMTLGVTRAETAITVLNMTSCKPGKSSIKVNWGLQWKVQSISLSTGTGEWLRQPFN